MAAAAGVFTGLQCFIDSIMYASSVFAGSPDLAVAIQSSLFGYALMQLVVTYFSGVLCELDIGDRQHGATGRSSGRRPKRDGQQRSMEVQYRHVCRIANQMSCSRFAYSHLWPRSDRPHRADRPHS